MTTQTKLETADDPLHQGSAPDTLWTTTNTAEALPGVLTPLAWTFWNKPCELGMRRAFHRLGVVPASAVRFAERPDDRYSAVFCGRYAANVEALRSMGDAMPGTSANALEAQLLGTVRPGLENHPRWSRYPIVAVSMPVVATRVSGDLARTRQDVDVWWRASVVELTTANRQRAQQLLVEATRRFEAVMAPHTVATMLCQAMYEQVTKLVAAAGQSGLERELITGYGDVEETVVVADLWAVANGTLALADFLDRHGYHGPNEGQASSRSWREDPSPLEAQLAALGQIPADASPVAMAERRRLGREAAEAGLLASLPRRRRPLARLVLRLARRFVPLREVGKAAFLQCIDVGRAAAHRLGDLLQAEGILADAEDVALVTVDELTGDLKDISGLVEQRRAQRACHLATRIPDSWVGEPTRLPRGQADEPDTQPAQPGDQLVGLGVSPGIYEGVARVVDDPATAVVEPGEVLVCETTDPSWAPLMFVAGALAIDIGGAVSHGAIVARELGVPCVMGTKHARTWLHTGDRVRVDGAAGTVTRLL